MFTIRPPSLGDMLRRYRVAAGLTQETLAVRAGVSARAVSDLERGVYRAPHKKTIESLADALHLSGESRDILVAATPRRGLAADSTADHTSSALLDQVGLPPFIGRTVEMALVHHHLDGLGPPILLVAGEPGIGKSRLLQEAARSTLGFGWRVLEGRCHRHGGQEPYAPLLGALKGYIRDRTPNQLRADLHGCAWLVRLLPELAGGPIEPLPVDRALEPEQERRLMFDAVSRFLVNIAGPAGVLLLLDDLQWVGLDALYLIATLARSALHVPLRIVGAYRDTDVQPDDPLLATVADLAHAALVVHHILRPLGPSEARWLLDDLMGSESVNTLLRQRALQHAGGVPFFLVSYAHSLRGWPDGGRRENVVPWDLAHGLRQRFLVLSEVAQEVLAVAAVMGHPVSYVVLVAATGYSEREILDALDAACRARLLMEEGDAYTFAHDVIREVVEADLGAARRVVLHRRVAEALEGGEEPALVEALAYHYHHARVWDKACLYLEHAGDKARAEYANAAAVTYYHELVRCMDRLGRRPGAARAREKLGGVLRTVARYDAALVTLTQAADIYRDAKDVEALGQVTAQIGQVYGDRGTPAQGIEHIQVLLASFEGHAPSRGLAALHAALAQLCNINGRYEDELAAADRAVDIAYVVGDSRTIAEAEANKGLALINIGRDEEALRPVSRAIRAAELAGDLTNLCLALNIMGVRCMYKGDFGASSRYMSRALEIATQQGDLTQVALMTSNCGEIAFWSGEWGQARAGYERSVELGRQIGASWSSSYPLLNLGQLRLAEGEWDEVPAYVEKAVEIAMRAGDLQALRSAYRVLAEHHLLQGRPDEARDCLISLLDRPGLEEWDVTPLLPYLAWAYLETGDVECARVTVVSAVARARRQTNRLSLVDALWIEAVVAIRHGGWDVAVRSLEEGLILARSMPYPYAEGRMHYVYGMFYSQIGDFAAAEKQFQASLTVFRHLGAERDAECGELALVGSSHHDL